VETTTARPPQVVCEGTHIPAGQRNVTLTSLAGAMRRQGASEATILAALAAENQRCDPPLPDAEIQGIAASIGRYPSGPLDRQGPPRGVAYRGLRYIPPADDPWLGPREQRHGVPMSAISAWKEEVHG
jgi:hypothetical protein